jgi:tryptophanyl-tRNA synthetase
MHAFFFSPPELVERVRIGCRTAGTGGRGCKGALADNAIAHLTPIRAPRDEPAAAPADVDSVLEGGRVRASETMSG